MFQIINSFRLLISCVRLCHIEVHSTPVSFMFSMDMYVVVQAPLPAVDLHTCTATGIIKPFQTRQALNLATFFTNSFY